MRWTEVCRSQPAGCPLAGGVSPCWQCFARHWSSSQCGQVRCVSAVELCVFQLPHPQLFPSYQKSEPVSTRYRKEGNVLVVLPTFSLFCTFSSTLPEGEGSLPVHFLLLLRVCEMEECPGWKTEAEHCFPTVVQTHPARLMLWSRL